MTNADSGNTHVIREDARPDWYGEWSIYSYATTRIPKLYWLGMVLSSFWILGYFILYPSIPLVMANTHWKGIGISGGCQPWTAICEMENAEASLYELRGRYLDKIRATAVQELVADAQMVDFISRAGRVRFEDNCAGCHGKNGAGIAKLPEIAPALNNSIWAHGADASAIQVSILAPQVHPFGLADRTDELQAKILAVYVQGLAK